MHALNSRQTVDLPTRLPHAKTPIDLFCVDVERFIQHAHRAYGLGTRQQTGAAHPVRADSRFRWGPAMAREIRAEQTVGEPGQSQPLRKETWKIVGGSLKAAIWVYQGWPNRSGGRMCLHPGPQGIQCVREHN